MIFYVSGEYDDSVREHLVLHDIPVLSSFAYADTLPKKLAFLAKHLRAAGKRMDHMLDSGAFTTWSKGGEVDIDALCDTCNAVLDQYGDVFNWTFIALDVIPGKKGRAMTDEDIATACVGSARNYGIMRQRVKGYVKPVFHVGDPDWLIEEYKEADYIGLGFSQAIPERERVAWARTNVAKFAGKRLHGLAATGRAMLRCAPWHSVDSAAGIYAAAMGGIAWMRPDGTMSTLAVSEHSPKIKDFDAHYDSLPPLTQRVIADRVEACGFTIERLRTDYKARWIWNIERYNETCQAAEAWYRTVRPKAGVQEELFSA